VYLTIRNIVDDLVERLKDLYVGKHSPWAVIQGIIWALRQWITILKEQFSKLFKTVAPAFKEIPKLEKGKPVPGKMELRAVAAIRRALQEAFDKVLPFIKQMTTENWLLKRLDEIAERFKQITNVFTSLKEVKKKKESPGTWQRIKGSFKEYFIGKLKEEAAFPADLELPKAPAMPFFPIASETFLREQWEARMRWKQPDMLSYFSKPGGGYVFTLSREAEEAAKQLRRPPFDVFASERRTLLKGKKREDLLAEAQATEASLRVMLFTVIDSLLPPAVTEEMPKLQGLLWELDEFLYGKKAEFPVRDLPGGDRLSVKVGRLRVQVPGMRDRVVRTWGDDLKIALKGQVYRTQREVTA
jgi:hypothetical protein